MRVVIPDGKPGAVTQSQNDPERRDKMLEILWRGDAAELSREYSLCKKRNLSRITNQQQHCQCDEQC